MGFDVWDFSARSLLRPYGRLFLRSVVVPHPLRFLAGLWNYTWHVRPARDQEGSRVGVSSWAEFAAALSEGDWLVGMGFCQKPLDPPCPSGRFNHRCRLLEHSAGVEPPPACRGCQIREAVERALPAGAAIYILTSASDVARDLLLPAMRGGVPGRALLSVCPYSVPPLTLAMSICGLRGIVQSYSEGDCKDFAMWVRADGGDKPEQTCLPQGARRRLLDLLDRVSVSRREKGIAEPRRYMEAGNLYVPEL